jgi:hypothetical protein
MRRVCFIGLDIAKNVFQIFSAYEELVAKIEELDKLIATRATRIDACNRCCGLYFYPRKYAPPDTRRWLHSRPEPY